MRHFFSRAGSNALACLSLCFIESSVTAATSANDPNGLQQLIDRNIAFAEQQYEVLLANIEGKEGLPRAFENGEIAMTDPRKWTSGFLPGALWQLFEATGDPKWEKRARAYTARLNPLREYRGTHDLGMMLFSSFGRGLELTSDEGYRQILLQGADNLASRFDDEVGSIRSWDWGKDRFRFPVIIDNMMNLKLLAWSAQQGADRRSHLAILVAHAETTYRNHFREDGSVWHVVDYDPDTGFASRKITHQGRADDSRWARGQAWAVYGFADCGAATGLKRYLDRSRETARLCLALNAQSKDGVPPWDYDDPAGDEAPRDVSAAAILASGMLELASLEADALQSEFFAPAVDLLSAISQDPYRNDPGAGGGFLLDLSTGNLPKSSEINSPIIYADYYFLEANLRLNALLRR